MAAPTKIRMLIAFAALYLVWGSTYLGIRFAIETMPPFLMAGSRFLLAGVIMFAIAWSQGAYKASWANWRVSLIVGACLLLAGNGGVTIAEKYIDSGLAALIVAIVRFTLSFSGGRRERPPGSTDCLAWSGWRFCWGWLFAWASSAFFFNGGQHPAIGMSILLVSSFIWSAGSLYSRSAKHAPSPFLTASQQMLCGGLLLLLAGIVTGELRNFHPRSISMLSLASFIYLIIIGAVVGYTAYIWLLRHCEPAKVATYAYVNPIVAVLLGAGFAGEKLSMRVLIAAALIIGSVAIVITTQQLRARAVPAIGSAIEPAD